MCIRYVIEVNVDLIEAIRSIAPEEPFRHLAILEETPSISEIKLPILHPSVNEKAEGESSLGICCGETWQNERKFGFIIIES